MKNTIPNITVANDVGAVGSLRKVAKQDKAEALKTVAKQFEAIMLQQLLKTSRETSFDDGFGGDMPGSGSMDNYREWRDEQFAQTLSSKGSLGFADMIVKQLMTKDRKTNATAITDSPAQLPAAQPLKHTMPNLVANDRNSGWWRVPSQAEVVAPTVTEKEVALPSTEDALLLHNLLQGRLKNQVSS